MRLDAPRRYTSSIASPMTRTSSPLKSSMICRRLVAIVHSFHRRTQRWRLLILFVVSPDQVCSLQHVRGGKVGAAVRAIKPLRFVAVVDQDGTAARAMP